MQAVLHVLHVLRRADWSSALRPLGGEKWSGENGQIFANGLQYELKKSPSTLEEHRNKKDKHQRTPALERNKHTQAKHARTPTQPKKKMENKK